MNDLATIGDRIRHQRELRGWSLRELARRAHIGAGYLSQVEKPQGLKGTRISCAHLMQIAEALQVSPLDLLQNTKPRQKQWWEQHPAYDVLCGIYKRSTASPHHLAFLALVGLREQGYDIKKAPHA